MLNITRLHNAVSAISFYWRMINISIDYAHRWKSFGKLIINHSLHKWILIEQELILRGNVIFVFEIAHLLNKIEMKIATESEK